MLYCRIVNLSFWVTSYLHMSPLREHTNNLCQKFYSTMWLAAKTRTHLLRYVTMRQMRQRSRGY